MRVLAGQKTLLARDVHDIRYDPVHDEVLLTNPRAQAILVFRGGATGEEPPIRVIQGPHTQLVGSPGGGPLDRLEVDPVHNEIFVPVAGSVLVFARDAVGDVAPVRAISGPATQLEVASSVVVDPVHNLMIVASGPDIHEAVAGATASRIVQKRGAGKLLIFNRTDSGNVKPRAIIEGPRTRITRINQMQVYPPTGWIIATQPGPADQQEPEGAFVGIWSINDNGDAPPRWVLRGPKSTLKKPRGVALDPKHKELIVADMRLNAILTFYFPEIF